MVTFNCEVCNDTVPKKNTEKHYYRCPNAYYTCIDCNKTFDDGVSYQKHTQCISEDEKYQKNLYKGKKKSEGGAKAERKAEPSKDVKKDVKDVKSGKTKPEKTRDTAKDAGLVLVKGMSLYKILKDVKSKDKKKELLKRLVVTSEDKIELQ